MVCSNNFDLLVKASCFEAGEFLLLSLLSEFLNSLFPVYTYDHYTSAEPWLFPETISYVRMPLPLSPPRSGFWENSNGNLMMSPAWSIVPFLFPDPLGPSFPGLLDIPLGFLHPSFPGLSNRKSHLAALRYEVLDFFVARKKKAAYEQTETQFISIRKRKVKALSRVFSWWDMSSWKIFSAFLCSWMPLLPHSFRGGTWSRRCSVPWDV